MLKKRNALPIILLLLLSVVAVYFYLTKNTSTFNKELTNFSVKDTASINKIFLSTKDGRNVLLEKEKEGKWKVNNKFYARKDAISILLKTLHAMKVSAPIGRAGHNTVIQNLATAGTKCEIYINNDLEKVIYVGGTNLDFNGNFMLLEGSSKPFIVSIPGFEGYLHTRFIVDEQLWRERSIFSIGLRELEYYEMKDLAEPQNSFKVSIKDLADNKKQFNLFNAQGIPVNAFDTAQLASYLHNMLASQYELKADAISKGKRDSAMAKPLAEIILKGKNKYTSSVKLFAKPVPKGTTDYSGNLVDFDVDRCYGVLDNQYNDFYICQYFVFDKIIVPVSTFIRNNQKVVSK